MFKIFNKDKFPTKIFVIASLLNLILLISVFFILASNFTFTKADNARYFFKDDINQNDPYVTSIPNLKEMLEGPIISEDDPILGSIEAPVVIVNFSDFQCEFCEEQESVIKKILNEYGDQVSYLWKDYPELVSYSNSWKSSIAARCAQEQGKFWEYHDLLYSKIDVEEKDKDFYVDLAEQIGLRKNTFEECLDDPEIATLIHSNILEAQALDIYGIPFVYVNNQEVMGEITYEDLKTLVDLELSQGGS